MTAHKSLAQIFKTPQIVGTIHSAGSLRRAGRLSQGAVDFLEARVDHFLGDLQSLIHRLPRLSAQCIVTVRHPLEGGAAPITDAQRILLFRQFIPLAAIFDVELRSAEKLGPLCLEAKAAGVALILSHHDFLRTPPLEKMRDARDRAYSAGANVFKIAAKVATLAELGRLVSFLSEPSKIPLAVMGMGKFGKISRLLLAQGGSVLNYGFLDQPQVSGQWEATLLKKRLAELSE